MRGADEFLAGSADMFMFAFGAPKVREVDATVGGIRALEISEAGHGRRPQDLPVRLSDRGQPWPGIRRRARR